MTAKWIDDVLVAGATLDLHHPEGRAQLAERIFRALPIADIQSAIAGSTRAVLEQRGLVIGGGVRCPSDGTYNVNQLVKEFGRNAGQTVLYAIEEPPDVEIDVDPATYERLSGYADRRGISVDAAADEILGTGARSEVA